MRALHAGSTVAVALTLAFAAGCGGGGGGLSVTGAAPPSSPARHGRYEAKAAADAPAATAPPGLAQPAPEPVATEGFKDYGVNPFVDASKDRLSTFSIDVDTASYSFSRRALMREGRLPPYASVRAEEFVNSFDYGYSPPDGQDRAPFKVHFAASPSPFTQGHHLIRVGVQAKRITAAERAPVHLVYLVDVSGSMSAPDRLPLARKSLKMLTERLKEGDTVALCTYAGSTRVVLEPTGIEQKSRLLSAIDSLGPGGSTAMASGIQLAYDLASRTLVKGHVNRVVVLSDGDANVGATSHEALLSMISQYKNKGITLSTVGFGSGNYQDTMMEQLADKGDGNYSYIDDELQAKKVFVDQVEGLLQVVARDVKIQVELDPKVVRRYRLVGYENRDIADKDFRNDKIDAGEVGAGHSVTAIYDVELASPSPQASPLVVRMRHKPAKNALHGGSDEATETKFEMPASAISASFDGAPESFRFAVAVASFAEILRQSTHAASWSLADVQRIATASSANRPERTELVSLVQTASQLSGRPIAKK